MGKVETRGDWFKKVRLGCSPTGVRILFMAGVFENMVYALALSILRKTAQAEDAVQNAYVRAFR